jgi:hypothetical protein
VPTQTQHSRGDELVRETVIFDAEGAVVAVLLGYSDATTQLHAEIAAQPWARLSPNPHQRPLELHVDGSCTLFRCRSRNASSPGLTPGFPMQH